jgi:hypothetical protein
MNYRLKCMGQITAEQLDSKLLSIIAPDSVKGSSCPKA